MSAVTSHGAGNGAGRESTRVLPHAPAELLSGRLTRLGEGIGKVVYGSPHWVVKRERHPQEILALVTLWKALRRLDKLLPGRIGNRLLNHPGKRMKLLRALARAFVLVAPRWLWFMKHAREVGREFLRRAERGERLADQYLAGTALAPETVSFPPVRVKVGRWPGWLVVEEATERVEATLEERINDLARSLRFDEIETWLMRLLELRKAAWKRGVFSLDAHLKNYGVTADRVVLLDAGGLTDHWSEIEDRLLFESEITSPHVQLGMEFTLRDRPDIAERFDAAWRATVNAEAVKSHWPGRAEEGS
jgi:hypothetical protein